MAIPHLYACLYVHAYAHVLSAGLRRCGMSIYTHVDVHIYTHAYAHAYAHICAYVYRHVCTHVCTHACTHAYVHGNTHVDVHGDGLVYAQAHGIHMSGHIYIYMSVQKSV